MVGHLYAGQEFHAEYDERIRREFAGDELTQFVIALRNVVGHVQPHLPIGRITLHPAGHDCYVYLAKDELTGPDWEEMANKLAKAFADGQPDEIRIKDFAAAYHAKVMAFYTWLNQRQDSLHAAALDELKRLVDRVRAHQAGTNKP